MYRRDCFGVGSVENPFAENFPLLDLNVCFADLSFGGNTSLSRPSLYMV